MPDEPFSRACAKNREKNGGKNRNDSDDDEKFDESKAVTHTITFVS